MSKSTIKASALSAANENTLALAAAHFDFSLVKVEAHPDFASIGPALTLKRRSEAEEGPQHKIARRLAALFEQVVPSTPKLISAYGKRVCEILNTPGVNPQGQSHHGPFKEYVGADGTAIWAAATSGTFALGVYLLAAMLAQAWDVKTAISIWVELIEARKKQIIDAFERHEIVAQSSLLGAQQDFSRDDLAAWDASARAWLRCTETAKKWERCQHMLIFRNISPSFATAPTTYESVTRSWQSAMHGMEDLLCERPQMLTDAAMMLAFKAWNLYPDMIVLGKETTKIQFSDDLIPPNAIVTIGPVNSPDAPVPSRWSLTLSHLRYYGRPKIVQSDNNATRISLDTLRLTTLGALFGHWRLSTSDTNVAAKFIVEIWTRLGKTQTDLATLKLKYLGWLGNLAAAAQLLLSAREDLHQEYLQIVYWGQRRAMPLLVNDSTKAFPFFGLSSEDVLYSLSKGHDPNCGIAYMRDFAARVGIKWHNAFILYAHYDQIRLNDHPLALEIATATPKEEPQDSLTHDVGENGHMRWLLVSKSPDDTRDWRTRRKRIEEEKERIYVCQSHVGLFQGFRAEKEYIYTNLPSFFHTCGHQNRPHMNDTVTEPQTSCSCSRDFTAIWGNDSCGLYVRNNSATDVRSTEFFRRWGHGYRWPLRPALALSRFKSQELSEIQLWNYICLVDNRSPTFEGAYERLTRDLSAQIMIAEGERHSNELSQSLHALATVSIILSRAGDVSVSAKVISKPIHSAPWIPGLLKRDRSLYFAPLVARPNVVCPDVLAHPSVEEIFSCIAYLETGKVAIEPNVLRPVFALCSGNSIYVAGRLLSDPAEVQNDKVHHLVGNIGQPGLSFLIAPTRPEIRENSFDYRVVNHAPYDRQREDNFKSTSLHLGFTSWSLPLNTDSRRSIDVDVRYLEAVIKVLEGPEWVADLDIMNVQSTELTTLEAPCKCGDSPNTHTSGEVPQRELERGKDFVSLDSWEELLDPPPSTCIGVFRAHGNWAARLAAVSILVQKGQAHSVGLMRKNTSFCLECMEAKYGDVHGELEDSESGLPSIVID